MSLRPIALVLALVAAACGSSADASSDESDEKGAARDWRTHPAIVEVDDAGEVYAVSDVHGHFDAFAQLLVGNGLMDAVPSDPKKAKWTGGRAILVVAGDLIDKGPQSVETIDLARALEASAARAGGRVIVTMGNHEAEFLADPKNDKATSTDKDETGIDVELDALGITPKSLGNGTDAAGRGAWLAGLPFAARIKKWFFAHGGNTSQMSFDDLAAKLQRSLDHNGWSDKDLTGGDSILEAQNWYGKNDDNAGQKEADALGVKHIVFGHDPGALDHRGEVRASKSGVLVKIDTSMGLRDASGVGRAYLLHISTVGKDTAEALDADGKATPIL